jgi:hypothetical protein
MTEKEFTEGVIRYETESQKSLMYDRLMWLK